MREMAFGLRDRGWEVDILTTCARDHHTWVNEYPAGVFVEDGVVVRRFPAVVSTRRIEKAAFEQTLSTGTTPPLPEQERWMNDGVRMPELYHYLLDHAAEYQALVFGPYLFWMAFACSQVAPERSVLLACLHDEPEAYLEIFRPVFSGVAGLLFMTEPEHGLAHRIHDRLAPHDVVGCGLYGTDKSQYDPEGFRSRHGIEGPFVLYLGRREGAKGWPELLETFASLILRTNLPLSLVTAGGGAVEAPPSIADRVIDLGFLSDAERDNALAAAAALVQPSRFEAFSRTIMEAWLAGTPVIVNGACDVLVWHCERSGAGLTFDDEFEFEQCLQFVTDDPEAAAALAAPGRDYVLSNYGWDAVLDGIEENLGRWLGLAKERRDSDCEVVG
jgi:glycosyltransferase involved in cell wall biosynthesis